MRVLTAAVLSIAALASAAAAQSPPTGDYYTWKCTFPGFDNPMTLIFDLKKRSGLIVGNLGTSPAEVRFGNDAVSFMEVLQTGAVQTLTIIFKTGAAVYSRHSVIDGKFTASQTQGSCQPTP